MKRKDIIVASCIFVVSSLLAVHLTSLAMLNKSLLTVPELAFLQSKKTYAATTCGQVKAIQGLETSIDPQMRKLAEYQQVCGGNPAARFMIFADMPNSDQNAIDKAKRLAANLKEFDARGITPLVILEPVTDWGTIDFAEFREGFYDAWLTTYFSALKSEGITDKQMGMWVPFPEANLPYWNHQNSRPDDFAANVTKTISLQKQLFPQSKASIMLNSATYENDDFDWRRGEYVSLLPYVKNIPDGLVDSFGYQGLPWVPPATQTGAGVLDAAEYLNYTLADEAAKELAVRSIWFNTGTFGRKYTLDPQQAVSFTPEQRKDILSGVLVQAQKLRALGYEVAVNIFGEDKSQSSEATDWSYWPEGKPKSTLDTVVFADFVYALQRENIQLWLFDKAHK